MVGEFLNGYPYVCGGWDGDVDLDECYTRVEDNEHWIRFNSLLNPRGFTSDIKVQNNNGDDGWWITGGFTSANATEILFDDHFVPGVQLPEDMHYHCMATINNSHVFMAGSNYGR